MLPITFPYPVTSLLRASRNEHLKTCLLFLIGSLLTPPILAQGQPNQATGEKPPINFQVLKRRDVVVGDHTVTFQLVAPPQIPAAPAPAPRVLSPEELANQQRREGKQQTVLFFSAAVFDRRVTELSWLGEDGKKYRGFSNIDFQYFNGLGEIETGDAIYTLMMAFDTGTAEALAEHTRVFPQLSQLPNGRAAWLLVEGSAEEGGASVTAWDSIHRWFDANRGEVIRGHQQRETAKAEKERIERERPPARKNRVISYWRKSGPPPPAHGGNPP